MSLISTFVDAFKRAVGKQPTKPEVDIKTHGPLGSTYDSAGGLFEPLRPTPESDPGSGVGSHGPVAGDAGVVGDPGFTSGDPEEGGEDRSA